MPDFDLNQPINWEHIQDFDGLVIDLNYDFEWDEGDNEVVNHGGGDEDDKQLGQGNGGTHDMIGLAGTHDMLRVASRG
ncbi:hypothetical protein GUJ93_ZPchr0004g39290 [Zizania palustris]|uniref:Uncharacterized protein n=1 Tax=Zizania palustris TaxID=103762 RepID=A0A8J5VG21_ZIZPA|nr:hypothetical protein GUJ93_ZPchr0004g39290 [Zizania palustris]